MVNPNHKMPKMTNENFSNTQSLFDRSTIFINERIILQGCYSPMFDTAFTEL